MIKIEMQIEEKIEFYLDWKKFIKKLLECNKQKNTELVILRDNKIEHTKPESL